MLQKFLIISSLCLSAFTLRAEPIETLNWVGCGISKKAYVTDLALAFEQKPIFISMSREAAPPKAFDTLLVVMLI